jgi:hypothetical protein
MALADFNRLNPFIIKMRHNSDELNKNVMSTIKLIFIAFAVYLISLILVILFGECSVFSILFLTTPLLISGVLLYNTMKLSEMRAIDDIIYGDEYKDIYVNNEKIDEIIGNLQKMNGRILLLHEYVMLQISVYFIVYVVIILTYTAKYIH